ncbi:ABC transporter ATP-binding protein, partial [uncultured Fusobacterium sp.]
RVSLARALVMEPGVLLFDEPLSNLDAKLRIHMRDEIRKIQQQVGITSIYVTHDQAEAMGLADKVIIMKEGRIQQAGSPIEVYQNPVNEFVANFIGRANIFTGKLVYKTDSKCTIDVYGVRYEVPQKVTHNIGDEIKIVARPESIIISKDDFKGKVTKSMFMGAYHEYEVMFQDLKVEISVSNPRGKKSYALDSELDFSLDVESIHIL